MRTQSLRPATVEECNRVLAGLRDLTAAGFNDYYAERHERENKRRAREGLPQEVDRPPTPITDSRTCKEIARARVFLRENCRKTKTGKVGSYGLKHVAERWVGETYSRHAEAAYISNGAFIAAAYLEGYTIKREGPNALFSLGFTPEYRRMQKRR